MESVFLETGSGLEVRLRPVVLFSILDHFLRRNKDQSRVIGTLLGSVHGGVVEVRNCFPVPHVEKTEEVVAVGKDFNRNMLALHRRVNPKEAIIGWYATSPDGSAISEFSCLIHDFYASECARPLHLVIDTSLRSPRLSVRTLISTPLSIADKVVVKFQQIKCSFEPTAAERIGLNMMLHNGAAFKNTSTGPVDSRALATSLTSDIGGLEAAITKLQSVLKTVSDYVDAVVEGRTEPDIAIGRRIADTLASVPRVDPSVFDKMFNDSLQDLLMVVYLSQLTRTQIAIAEKLTTSA